MKLVDIIVPTCCKWDLMILSICCQREHHKGMLDGELRSFCLLFARWLNQLLVRRKKHRRNVAPFGETRVKESEGKGGPTPRGVLFDPFYSQGSIQRIVDGASKRWTDSGLNHVFTTAGTDILMKSRLRRLWHASRVFVMWGTCVFVEISTRSVIPSFWLSWLAWRRCEDRSWLIGALVSCCRFPPRFRWWT